MRVACLRIGSALGALLACSQLHAGEETIRLTDAPGRPITVGSCAVCHSLDYIQSNQPVMDRGRWEQTVAKMISKFGAPISAENARIVVDYLSVNYSAEKD